MSNVFCTECGTKHKVVTGPPKFCSSCGANMNQGFQAPPKRDSIYESEDYVPRMSKAKVKIEIDSKATIGSLNSMPIPLEEVIYSGQAQGHVKKTKQELISEIMRDCAPVTRSKSVDE